MADHYPYLTEGSAVSSPGSYPIATTSDLNLAVKTQLRVATLQSKEEVVQMLDLAQKQHIGKNLSWAEAEEQAIGRRENSELLLRKWRGISNSIVLSQETLVLLLDIGPTMHQHLEYMSKSVSALVHRKLLHNKFDEVGVVYFGADYTENALSDTLEGYENIVVARQLSVVADDLAQTMDKLPKGFGLSDFVSAVVVGMDMIVTKLGPNSKGNKRICLITDGETLVKDPDEGTKEDQVSTLANQMQQQGVSMDAVIIRLGGPNNSIQSKSCQENEFLLGKFASCTKGELILTETYNSLLGAIRTRQVSPTTIYRGDLELTSNMSVKVWVYKKVSPERPPTLKMYSGEAPSNDTSATHEVKLLTDYKTTLDLDASIPPEQRIKAYKYGPQFVPISSKEEDVLKFKTEKGLKLIGFTDSANVPRHYSMKEANVFVPEPGDARSAVAVSSLVRALAETRKVAIVRCVWRAGQTNVVLGVLTPNIATDDDVADCFYFNILPFSEDLREYPFPSFNDLPDTQQPTSIQQEAADALVQMMDLAPLTHEEKLRPERTVNPVLQRFYTFLHLKSVDPDAKVPPLDDVLRSIIEPEPSFLHANELSLKSFSQQFTLTYNTQNDKGRKFWKEGLEGGEAEARLPAPGEDVLQFEDQKPLSLDFLTNKKVEDVGSVNPVEDFEAMLARHDSDLWVPRAINGMKKIISDLLSSAYNGNTYEKAIACLVALRSGCVIHARPKDFNSLLEEIAEKCQGKRLSDFLQQIVQKNLTLISKDEAPDSEVTQDEAVSFLSGQRNLSKDIKEEEVDEMEALFDDII